MDGASESGLKLPPHSTEAEQSVLGGLLLDNTAYDRIADKLSEGDFYTSDHAIIYRAIVGLFDKRHEVDIVTVAEALENREQLKKVGGIAYLGELAQNTPGAANIERYAEIVRERAVRVVVAGCLMRRERGLEQLGGIGFSVHRVESDDNGQDDTHVSRNEG